jgi:uncharacterized membrane protein YqaE (UPF0057 family)
MREGTTRLWLLLPFVKVLRRIGIGRADVRVDAYICMHTALTYIGCSYMIHGLGLYLE